MKRSIIHIIFPALLIWLASCSKETQTSEGNPVPVIEHISTAPVNVTQFKDSIIITFSYEDGDGDLGWVNADIQSLEIKDQRLAKPDMYYVAPLSPDGSKVHIKGTLRVVIKNLFLISTANTEVTTLSLRLQDRVGNWSNKINSLPITIHK